MGGNRVVVVFGAGLGSRALAAKPMSGDALDNFLAGTTELAGLKLARVTRYAGFRTGALTDSRSKRSPHGFACQ
jgi:hypothetical protein